MSSDYPVEDLANGRISRVCPSSFTVGSSQAREEKIAHDKSPSSRQQMDQWMWTPDCFRKLCLGPPSWLMWAHTVSLVGDMLDAMH